MLFAWVSMILHCITLVLSWLHWQAPGLMVATTVNICIHFESTTIAWGVAILATVAVCLNVWKIHVFLFPWCNHSYILTNTFDLHAHNLWYNYLFIRHNYLASNFTSYILLQEKALWFIASVYSYHGENFHCLLE